MLPKIGKCVCFTLCWILLCSSWRISEIISALPCRAVLRNSLMYVHCLGKTPWTKKMPLCMHMTSKRSCTGHSSARGRKNDRICPASYVQIASIWDQWCGPATLAHVQCKTPADISWLPGGTCTSCPAALLQLPAHWELAEQHFSEACPLQCNFQLHCPSSYTILGLTLSPNASPCPGPQTHCR